MNKSPSQSTTHLLYGVEGSYYAAKVRSYLIQKRIPFKEITADRRAFDEVILPRVGYPIIPIVITPQDEILQDSSVIIDTLEQRFPDNPLIPTDLAAHFVTRLVELYADEWLKLPALYYRWHYDSEFAIQMMGENNDPNASPEQQRHIGQKIAANFQKWPKHLGVDHRTRDTIEQLLHAYLSELNAHFDNNKYLLGNIPTLADCALMGPLYAHLFRDPYSGEIVRREAPKICEWIMRMQMPSNHDAMIQDHDYGTSSLATFLKHISRDYVPMISTALRTADSYLTANPSEDRTLPRYLGHHPFDIGREGGKLVTGNRSVHTVEIWKLQQLISHFKDISDSEQTKLQQIAETLGASELLNLRWENCIRHEDFRFVLDNSC